VGAFNASFRLLTMEHLGRIAFQGKTRSELGGPFFRDYARSVKIPNPVLARVYEPGKNRMARD
jgi:hypothetical protein